MQQLQRIIASEKDVTVIAKYYKKKFAREARWEAAKERLIQVMEFFNISYKTYAEEYEDFVTMKMKQKGKWDGGKCTTRGNKDYYQILGVERCASEEEIKRSFRVLIMQVHPDFSKLALLEAFTSRDADAEEKAKLLIEAYQILRNPEKRYIYDLSLH